MSKLKVYKLGLKRAAIEEYPNFKITDVTNIKAHSLKEAKLLWAIQTKNNDPMYWNEKTLQYWGWEIVEV